MKKIKKRWLVPLLLIVLALVLIRVMLPPPVILEPLEAGNIKVPTERSMIWNDRSEATDEILEYWAEKPLDDWPKRGKIHIPRALLARFALQHDLDAANEFLTTATPWGNAGSVWALHPQGDYDFTMAGLIPILYLFGDDPTVLYPEARDQLLNTLLPLEGGDPLVSVPRTLGAVRDTENHLLMTEGSRYLKNRWLALHGDSNPLYDNEANGLEDWLQNLIIELEETGPYEFNSIPYEGYTLTALLNLEAFGSERIQLAARNVLDQLNWNYALGSLDFRRAPPFRRRYEHADDTALDEDRHTPLMKLWISLLPESPPNLTPRSSQHIGIWACWSPYRLPDKTAQWILEKPSEYFVRIGHGLNGSPEIYSGGPGYLITAGGVHRGKRSLLVARPITLMLDDGITDLTQVLHLAGPGEDFREWNNTGVWHDFAVAAGPVYIPEEWTTSAEGVLWNVYRREADLCIAVHSRDNLGIVHLIRSSDPQGVLVAIEAANDDPEILVNSFQVPGGPRIDYAPDAPKDQWVIQSIDGQAIDRDFDRWPRLEGEGID
ncbi:hypothetical protein P4C99_03080 [Pontiellaceae bacterium B1224]|nr:hypothetical protein [Pontiellaceae bacterium B1224]